jgi:serine phosphatase RsbU (regulator of sigma subunit)
MIEHVRADLAAFVQDASQADDITLLALRYCGSAASSPA